MKHMDDGRLQAWLDGERAGLTTAEREEISAHITNCPECAARVAELRESDDEVGELLGLAGRTEQEMPDFAAVQARAAALAGERTEEAAAVAPDRAAAAPPRDEADTTIVSPENDTPGHRRPRRLPLRWAATVVVALGVGWMTNEILRTEPGAIAPSMESIEIPAARLRSAESEGEEAEGDGGAAADRAIEALPADPESPPPSPANTTVGVEAVPDDSPAQADIAERAAASPEASARPSPDAPDIRRLLTAVAGAGGATGADVDSVTLLPFDPARASWSEASLEEAFAQSGFRPARVPELVVEEVATSTTSGGMAVVRVRQRLEDGGVLTLYQSRSPLSAEALGGVAVESIVDGVRFTVIGVADLGADEITGLLGRIGTGPEGDAR